MDFTDILTNKFHFTGPELEITKQLFQDEFIQEKHFFVGEGKVAEKLGIVIDGLFRTFYVNVDADDITTAFHEPGSLLLSIDSFNNRVKSKENIIAIEDSHILSITLDDWKLLNAKVPKWLDICRVTGDYMGMSLQSRAREFQTLSARERYRRFCKKHPIVYQKATLGQIASFLGIDIATLSRIRKNP